jgi:hypothetical protein
MASRPDQESPDGDRERTPVADLGYVAEANRRFASAQPLLSAESQRVLELSQREARSMDANHVGTEHIVLGIFAAGGTAANCLTGLGITRSIFVSQLSEESGSSPPGTIPLTPRARMSVGLAAIEAGRGGNRIEPRDLVAGVAAESRLWE